MESDHISIFIKPELRHKAKAAGVNMSAVARAAIIQATKRLENKNVRAKVSSPNPDTDGHEVLRGETVT